MKDYKNVDEFMDDLEKMAVKGREKHSQLYNDYFTLKQWREDKFWKNQEDLPWEVSLLCINEMRKMLYALDISELKTLADRHDELAKAVYAKRCISQMSPTSYDGNVTDFISKLEKQLLSHDEQQ